MQGSGTSRSPRAYCPLSANTCSRTRRRAKRDCCSLPAAGLTWHRPACTGCSTGRVRLPGGPTCGSRPTPHRRGSGSPDGRHARRAHGPSRTFHSRRGPALSTRSPGQGHGDRQGALRASNPGPPPVATRRPVDSPDRLLLSAARPSLREPRPRGGSLPGDGLVPVRPQAAACVWSGLVGRRGDRLGLLDVILGIGLVGRGVLGVEQLRGGLEIGPSVV